MIVDLSKLSPPPPEYRPVLTKTAPLPTVFRRLGPTLVLISRLEREAPGWSPRLERPPPCQRQAETAVVSVSPEIAQKMRDDLHFRAAMEDMSRAAARKLGKRRHR